jgi:formylglycine-generating enzyme required for sulfatase activity
LHRLSSLLYEPQREKATKGIDGRKYPWGDHKPDKTLANFGTKIGKTTPVGSYPKGVSPYGLLDMGGNVWEWCSDWYNSGYYNSSSPINPIGSVTGSYRVLRGGGWGGSAKEIRCSYRSGSEPFCRGGDAGFRLCMEVSEHDL